jgi:hypothetical protein
VLFLSLVKDIFKSITQSSAILWQITDNIFFPDETNINIISEINFLFVFLINAEIIEETSRMNSKLRTKKCFKSIFINNIN